MYSRIFALILLIQIIPKQTEIKEFTPIQNYSKIDYAKIDSLFTGSFYITYLNHIPLFLYFD